MGIDPISLALIGSAVAGAAGVAQSYDQQRSQRNAARDAERNAQRQAQQAQQMAQQQADKEDQEFNRLNQRQAGNTGPRPQGPAGATTLTGPQGAQVDPGTLGRSTLLGM